MDEIFSEFMELLKLGIYFMKDPAVTVRTLDLKKFAKTRLDPETVEINFMA